MLCTEAQNLPELIVSHLAYQPEMNIEELQEAINPKLKKPITQRGWYKAVRGLLDSEVLVKTRRVYSLNYAWLEQMRLFSHITTATYLNEKDQQKNITHLKKGEQNKYAFPNIIAADIFWFHIFALLSEHQGNVSYYSYCPHYWFFLAHRFMTEKHYEAARLYDFGYYHVIGSRSDMDLWSEQQLTKYQHKYHYFSPKQLNIPSHIYPAAVGEYLITLRTTKDFAQKIDQLFKNTKFDINKENPPVSAADLFKQKSPTTVIVERNAEKADKFRRKIARYF